MSSPPSSPGHLQNHAAGQHVTEQSLRHSGSQPGAEEAVSASIGETYNDNPYDGNTESSRSSSSMTDEAELSRQNLLRSSGLAPHESPLDVDRRPSFTEEDETRADDHSKSTAPKSVEEKPVSWMSLPKKGQLAILTFARLSEPLTQTSLQAYMFYQLRSFDPSLPDSTISRQAGILQGIYTAAQFLTAMWWGRLADADWMGRKRVLLIGLFGTALQSLGFGFSRSFVAAAMFRTMGGILNGNVGVMRTMIAEIIQEKKYQSRAFLILPMCFNVGVIIGPIMGGALADPVHNFPGLFGPGSIFGGKDGVWWMQHWPYALPNLVTATFIFLSWSTVFLGLDETHEVAKYNADWGRRLGKLIVRGFRGLSGDGHHYTPLNSSLDHNSLDLESTASIRARSSSIASRTPLPPRPHKRPSIRELCTTNVILTLASHFLLAFHTSAFNAMTFVFLPTPRAPENTRKGFFHFSGGLGLSSSRVGLATAIIGCVGLPLQILVYPRVQFKLGTLRAYRTFLPFSPLAYLLMPFLVLLPRYPWLVWPAFTCVVSLQVISRTFALPATIILVNNCVTEASLLGTINGLAQSTSSAARTLGPLLGGWGLGLGLQNNIIGAVWWALAAEASLGWLLTWTIYEGKGIVRKKPGELTAEHENGESRPNSEVPAASQSR